MKHFIKIALLFIVFNSSLVISYAQNPEAKRASHWYFGNGAGLDFSSGSAVAVTDGALYTYEGCAAISDLNGNLLFYTDGDTIWDKNHNTMPNGTGLMGCSQESSIQSALIMPQPMNSNLYYVFTTDCGENLGLNGLRYSIVDMNLNGGLGDVVPSQKDILLITPVDECLTGVQVCDTLSWIMTHESNTSNYYSYKLTKDGIDLSPVINVIGQPFTLNSSSVKFSGSGRKFAHAWGGLGPFLELYDFDIYTGQLSNLKNLIANGGGHHFEFSPDEQYMYVSSYGNLLHQFNISSNNVSTINSSYTLIYQSLESNSIGPIQNSTDKKTYISAMDKDSISVINNPNSAGLACNFSYLSVSLNFRMSQFGLPNFSANYFNSFPLDSCSERSFVSNVFTPNNDGINDVFNLKIAGYKEVNYYIYNRWGTEIKKEELKIGDGTIDLWDGTINGKNASDGVYYYIINLKTISGKIKTEKGFLHLFH